MTSPAATQTARALSQRVPRAGSFDSTLALFRDPYEFISRTCRARNVELFETRILLRRTLCMVGPEAAALFYDRDRFVREGAAPVRIQKTLFGQGGVQGLDDEAHALRKRMFMSLMTPEHIDRLRERVDHWLGAYAKKWAAMDEVDLYAEVRELLTYAVCDWTGVPLRDAEVPRRARQLSALFGHAGSVGPKHWWARHARKRAEAWIERVVLGVRAHDIDLPADSPLYRIAWQQDPAGQLLEPRVAAVEVINLLRPVVAVSVYVVFVAHALQSFPDCRARLETGDDIDTERFVQEVRRFYPFFPAVVARVRQSFDWNGYHFPRGTRVMLDLHGTNHDPRAWPDPHDFAPDRYQPNSYAFIPQGGGNPHASHRCAGEQLTIELMKLATSFLTRRITYDHATPPADLDRTRLPALPRSPMVLSNVRPR